MTLLTDSFSANGYISARKLEVLYVGYFYYVGAPWKDMYQKSKFLTG